MRQPDSNRVPSLDGLRAISLAMVVFDHLSISRAITFRQNIIDFGNLGVRIFFIISGFIITHLLLQEKQRSGSISLKDFYIRRCFRILPLWSCYVGLVLAYLTIAHRLPSPRELLGVLTFNVDYLGVSAVDLTHLWSLSVEEKFYLIWPFLFCLCSERTVRLVAVATMIVVPICRYISFSSGALYEQMIYPSHVTADAIATGCLLALVKSTLDSSSRWRGIRGSKWLWTVPPIILGILACKGFGSIFWLFGITAVNLAIAIMIDSLTTSPGSIAGRLLNSRPFVLVGIWSYGAYLWQQPLTFRRKLGIVSMFPVNLLVLVAIAASGYYLLERPLQSYGRELARKFHQPIKDSFDRTREVKNRMIGELQASNVSEG